MDFMNSLPISTDWKRNSYNSILVIVDRLTKMVNYKPVKITINAPGFIKIIIDVVVRHHSLSNSIVTDRSSFFTSKFWSSLCYFLGIKQQLSTAFHPQTNGQTKRQNSIMETYLRAFINFKQINLARFLPIAEFVYNNAKNASTSHTPFELNYGYHPCVYFKEDTNPFFWSKTADKLSAKLRELMTVYQENLYYTQKLEKQAHNKGVNPKSYTPRDKVWLNSKYLKTKQNRKLKGKFFGLFQVLYLVEKQAYKLKLPKK